MHIPILFEDESLIVVDKPVGVIVNRAKTVKTETIQDWAEEKLSIKPSAISHQSSDDFQIQDFVERSGIVHRIDKETSGCLLIAKTPQIFLALQSQFKERLVKKTYTALVHGKLVPQTGDINAPVGRLPWNRERFGVVPGGKEAHTRYQVEHYYCDRENNQYSLINLFPTTGRTHQIRVHMKYLGFPLVGDYLYAGRKQQDHDRVWCPRVFLHAAEILFTHPVSEKFIKVESSLPSDLVTILEKLILQ